MILVVGATSRLGRAVVGELLAGGWPVRAACRHPAAAADLLALGAEVVAIDLRTPASFAPALDGVQRVFTAVHGLTGRPGDSLAKVDVEGHIALIGAAAGRVERFVYTSAMGAAPDHPVPFWRAKAEVERRLTRSGLSFTILRPSAFMDFHAHQLIGAAVLAGKPVNILGRGDARRNLVAVCDVATAAVAALTTDRYLGRTLEIGSPDSLSDLEVADLYARLSGRPAKIRSLGPGALRVLSVLIRPFHAGAANILRIPLQTEGRTEPPFDASGMAEILGRAPLTLAAYARDRAR